jgi:hypothetical protein
MKNLFKRDHEDYEVNLSMIMEGYEEDQCLIKLTKNMIQIDIPEDDEMS